MPPFDASRYHEAAVAVRSGETLRIPRTGVLPVLADLIDAMLRPDPTQRPTISQIHATLMSVRLPSETTTAASPSVATPGRPPSSALRGKGLRITGSADTEAQPTGAGRLVGKLVGKLTGRPRS
jgi:hypothetical protein